MRLILATLLAVALSPGAASAFVIQERGGLESAANGITLGPDGNLWAVEHGAGKVVRMKPDGTILGHFAVGASPTSIAAGPGGRVWVSVTGADKLVWIDATAATPTVHDLATAGFSDCGPVAVEPGGNGRIYFSMPNDGTCAASSLIGYTNDDGSGGTATADGLGPSYDLQVLNGKLFAPDFSGNVIRRRALDAGLTVESTVALTGGNPNGITADGAGRIWVTLYTAGQVAHFPATQVNGMASELAPSGGTLGLPFGIVAGGDGRIYVTGSDSANLARLDPATRNWTFYPVPGSRPWQIVNGPDEDLWFTDLNASRLLRFVNGKPRAATGEPRATGPSAAALTAKVDPRGNATTVVFDYGPTTAYGKSTAEVNLAEGAGAIDVQAALPDLAPSTTYHVRVRAANGEGEVTGADRTFTTPAAPVVAPARLQALLRLTSKTGRRYTVLTKVRVQQLAGGETVRITCKGRGCPFRARTFRNLGAGSRSFDRLFRRKRLRPKAVVQVRITKPGLTGSVTTVKIRRGRRPLITRRCLPPGTSKPTRC